MRAPIAIQQFLFIVCSLVSMQLVAQNLWTPLTDFPGPGRDGSFSIALDTDTDGIADAGYVGAGWNSNGTSYTDFWQYNPTTGSWTQKANYTGSGTRGLTSFVLNNKGYVVGGAFGGDRKSVV